MAIQHDPRYQNSWNQSVKSCQKYEVLFAYIWILQVTTKLHLQDTQNFGSILKEEEQVLDMRQSRWWTHIHVGLQVIAKFYLLDEQYLRLAITSERITTSRKHLGWSAQPSILRCFICVIIWGSDQRYSNLQLMQNSVCGVHSICDRYFTEKRNATNDQPT